MIRRHGVRMFSGAVIAAVALTGCTTSVTNIELHTAIPGVQMVQAESTGLASSTGHRATLTVVHLAAPSNTELGRPWKALAVDPRSRELQIQWVGALSPECGQMDTAYVTESAHAVVVQLAAENRAHKHLPSGVVACTASATTLMATITLDGPIGIRTLEEPTQDEIAADPSADFSGASTVIQCPASSVELTPAGAPGVRSHLVPFTPTAALLCGYTEFHPPYSAHPSRALAAGPTLRALTAAMNTAEDESARDIGPHLCPADHGITVDAYFSNATSRVEVHIDTTGCAYESNGAISDASLPENVSKLIAALVPPRSQVVGTPIR